MFEFISWVVLLMATYMVLVLFHEQWLREKTLRRMDDISNMYYDYNHKIWVNKTDTSTEPVAETQQTNT